MSVFRQRKAQITEAFSLSVVKIVQIYHNEQLDILTHKKDLKVNTDVFAFHQASINLINIQEFNHIKENLAKL
jgi:hypothetical protein